MNTSTTSTTSTTTTRAVDTKDLAMRLEQATAADTAKGMFFNGALSAVERALGPEARERCRKASGERSWVDFFSYPISGFLKLSFAAAELLTPELGAYDKAFRNLGQQAAEDLLATSVGKTLLNLAGGDPQRMLSSLPTAYKTAVSYGDRKAEAAGDKHCVVVMIRDFMPHPYQEGVLQGFIHAMGISHAEVKGRRIAQLDANYDISWE
jgi:uncharacterized protein (TIGR02265 family)